MSGQENQSLDGFMESLEKRARSARTISIVITIGTITLAALTLFFTIRVVRQQIGDEQAKLSSLQKQRQETEDALARLKQEYDAKVQQLGVSRDVSQIALAQLPEEKREAIIKKAVEINQTPSDSPKVYLQILDNNQRDQANAIGNKLRNAGFKFQGVEWVRVPVNLKQTQVKYFRPEFADEAQKITALLGKSGVQATPVGFNTSAGSIEVWFSADAFPKPTEHPGGGKGSEGGGKGTEQGGKGSDQSPSPEVVSYGSVTGYVFDAQTRAPISGARILLVHSEKGLKLEAITDGKGGFYLTKIPIFSPGQYLIAASHPDFVGFRRLVDVSANQVTNLQGLALQKRKPSAQPK